jgi:predicted TIM-barrel fold metal-dependent hydrolase
VSILPLWDANLAAEEVRRVAERGSRAICFSEVPARLGLPSMYSGHWDPLFAVCEDAGVVVCMHVGSSPSLTTSADAPSSVSVINFSSSTALSFTDWLMSGALVRFPDLKIAFAEGQVGWLPYVLDRIEVMWREGFAYNEVSQRIPERPSTYLKNMVFCLFDDWVGLSHLDVIGPERVCIETDYPHADGTFPNSRRRIGTIVKDLDERTRDRVVRQNAIDTFGFSI